MKRKYEIVITYEVDTKTQHEGLEVAKKMVKGFGFKVQSIKPAQRTRTLKQNRALHLYFTQLADALNEAGYDMRKTIREGIDIPWTPEAVKEHLWRPVQQVLVKKKSTRKLDTFDINQIYDTINRHIGERTGIFVPFPNIDLVLDRFEESFNNQ